MTTHLSKKESNSPGSSRSFLTGILGRIVLMFVLLGSMASLKPGVSQEKSDAGEKAEGTASEETSADLQPVPTAALIEKANQLIEAKDFQKAIPILELLVKRNPLDDKMKSYLARAYIAQGTVLQDEGKVDQSLDMIMRTKKLVSEINLPDPDLNNHSNYTNEERDLVNIKEFLAGNSKKSSERAIADEKARALLDKAARSYKEKQYLLAKTFAAEAIEQRTNNPLAYELLGDSEYFSQDLAAAQEAYRQAFLQDANDRVKNKLEKITKEINLESAFAEYADEHFLIRYKRSEKFEGSEIRQHLRDAYREVSQDFGHYLAYKTVVILYGKGEYEAIENMPHWSGALYDGKIRIPIYDGKSNSKNLKKYIQHELTHVFIIDMSDNRCPVWLHEGVAQYEEDKVIPVSDDLFKKAVKNKKLLSWEELNQGVSAMKEQSQAVLYYHQSFQMAQYLIEKHRFVKIKALFQQLAQKTPFDDAFKQVMGISVNDFYDQWRKVVDQQFS